MIFERKTNNPSSASIGNDVDKKVGLKAETLYVALICFAAACLSFMKLEVGSRSPLGQSVTKSSTFSAIFRRSYNMKIKIMITNVIMGLITTIMVILGDTYTTPYLYVPWLFNTMRGMLFYEGPALFGLSSVWLPDAGFPAATFIFITFLLFVEELCLWFNVLASLKSCWKRYSERKCRTSNKELPTADRENSRIADGEQQEPAADKPEIFIADNFTSVVKPPNILVSRTSVYPEACTTPRTTQSSSDGKRGTF